VSKSNARREKAVRSSKGRKSPLRALRTSLGITQEELARRAKMTQSEISRVELRSDCLISTLRRYLAALDCDLQISAQNNGRSYPVTIG